MAREQDDAAGSGALLSDLGLTLDEKTGVLQGRVRRDVITGEGPLVTILRLQVDDEDPETSPARAEVEMTLLPPMRFHQPQ